MLKKVFASLILLTMFIGGAFMVPTCGVNNNSSIYRGSPTKTQESYYDKYPTLGVAISEKVGFISQTY
jgi:hypothetical protein